MSTRPSLHTERLLLRPFEMGDAPRTKELAGDREIAAFTNKIAHPYEDGMAEEWIATHQENHDKGLQTVFAVTLVQTSELMGSIFLAFDDAHSIAELGYWIGVPYWGKGYATEASIELLRYGFEERDVNKIFARTIARNTASNRVLEKIGMKLEGRLRQQIRKWGRFEDEWRYGILREEYNGGTQD